MKINRLLSGISTLIMMSALICTNAFAQSSDEAIKASLAEKLSLNITSIADSPVPGLKQVFTDRG